MHRNPGKVCFGKHGSNSTLEYHQCMCSFDYSHSRSRVKALKIKHCLEESRMYKMTNFYTYIVIAAVLVVISVSLIVAFCSLKWYLETKQNPCTCCSFFCCCKKKRKKKRRDHSDEDSSTDVVDNFENGYIPRNIITDSPETLKKGMCMRFCLSEPVQDCCAFLDCDLFWRRETAYGVPAFGKKKSLQDEQMFHRRPSRPAPPPPKPVMLPQMKYPEPMIDDECEPVPEAPPSPEPIRVLSPRSLYVDPLSFLQKPFMKNTEKENNDEKQEPLYSKFKNMVMSRVRKSPSISAVNSVGLPNSNGISLSPDGDNYNNRNLRTGSLASLHNIGDLDDSVSSGSKRSLSLASLHMLDIANFIPSKNPAMDPRSRISVVSSATADDIPPSARKDEYIDLEEMSKRMAAKRKRAEQVNAGHKNWNVGEQLYVANEVMNNGCPSKAVTSDSNNINVSQTYTPNFIPASAFPKPMPTFNIVMDGVSCQLSPPVQHYYPPVPASAGRPAVPARMVGAPIYAISTAQTFTKQKPIVPPRPPGIDGGRNSPKTQALTRSPRIIKPTGPPPPPPQYPSKVPMESSI